MDGLTTSELVLFLAGIFFGISFMVFLFKRCFVGTLRIDTSDPNEEPYIFLELEKGMGEIASKKHITLKVDTKSYVPHK